MPLIDYINGVAVEMTPEQEAAFAAQQALDAAAQPLVPAAVTMRQARLALLGQGLLDDVEAAINALPEPTKSAARIEWDYSSEVRRQQPLVLALAPALGLTEQDLDALFIAAAQL